MTALLAGGINSRASRVGGRRMSAASPSAQPSRPPVTYITPDGAELVVSLQDHGERTWPTIDYSTPLGDGNVRIIVAQLDPDQDFCKCRDCLAANPERAESLSAGHERSPVQPVASRDSEPSLPRDPVAKLLSAFDALADLGAGSLMLHESQTPGAEYALSLWASARRLALRISDYDVDGRKVRAVKAPLDQADPLAGVGSITVLTTPPQRHRWVKVVGLCDPRAAEICIECSCGNVTSAATMPAAMTAYHAHL